MNAQLPTHFSASTHEHIHRHAPIHTAQQAVEGLAHDVDVLNVAKVECAVCVVLRQLIALAAGLVGDRIPLSVG
jgi:hypothetical protein